MGVAVGREVDRNAAGEQQCAVMGGLVIVAIEEHEVAVGDERSQCNLVGGRRPVENEIGSLGTEDRRRLLLRLERRAFMGEQVAEFEDRIVEIVAEHGFPKMFHENAADRAAAVENPAVVPGAGPQLVALLRIVDQRTEKRRLQRVGILREATDKIAGDELRRLLGQEDIAVDEVEHLDRHVLEPLAPHQQDDRHFETAPAHDVDERGGLALKPLLAPIDHEAADRGIGLHRHFRIFGAGGADDLEPHPLNGGDDLLDAQAFEVLGLEGRSREQERKPL